MPIKGTSRTDALTLTAALWWTEFEYEEHLHPNESRGGLVGEAHSACILAGLTQGAVNARPAECAGHEFVPTRVISARTHITATAGNAHTIRL